MGKDGKNIEIVDNKLRAEKDKEGKFAYFDGKTNNLFFKSEHPFELKDEFSISFWINPAEAHKNYGIIASDNSFVVKIRDGVSLSTIPGVQDKKVIA